MKVHKACHTNFGLQIQRSEWLTHYSARTAGPDSSGEYLGGSELISQGIHLSGLACAREKCILICLGSLHLHKYRDPKISWPS